MGSSSPQYFLLAILLLLLRARPAWDFPQSCGVWRSGARIDSIQHIFENNFLFSNSILWFAVGSEKKVCWWWWLALLLVGAVCLVVQAGCRTVVLLPVASACGAHAALL